MPRKSLVRLLRNVVAIGLLTAIAVLIPVGGMYLRKAPTDKREIRFRILPVSEWGFGKQSSVPIPLKAPPLVAPTPAPTSPFVGRMAAFSIRGRMPHFYRILLADAAEQQEAHRKAVAAALRSKTSLPKNIILPQQQKINLYTPQIGTNPYSQPAGVHVQGRIGGIVGATPTPPPTQAGIYWPFTAPRLPGVPGPYPSPTPSSTPTPAPPKFVVTASRGGRHTITQTVAGPNGKSRTVTYTTSVLPTVPPPAPPNVPGFNTFTSHSGMIVPETMLDQLYIEGERLRFGLFEITRLPRIRLERMN
jgi:hypothetical protein